MENLTSTARKRQQSEEQDGILNGDCLLRVSSLPPPTLCSLRLGARGAGGVRGGRTLPVT